MIENGDKYHESNFIDQKFQSAILPIHILEYLFFQSKYKIRNNFINPKGCMYNILSLFFFFFVLYAHYTCMYIEELDSTPSAVFYYVMLLNFILYTINNLVLYVNNVYNHINTTKLIINLQKIIIVTCEDLRRYDKCLNKWRIGNYCYVLLFILYYLVLAIILPLYSPVKLYPFNLTYVLYYFLHLFYDINILCASRYLKLLRSCLLAWMTNVQCYAKQCSQYSARRDNIDNKICAFKIFFDTYIKILKTFDLFEVIFQVPILLLLTYTFLHSLLYFEVFIELTKTTYMKNNTAYESFLSINNVIGWVCKNITILSLCIKECEEFYASVREAERQCLLCYENNRSLGTKQLYKNIRRLNRAKFNKMSVCRVFDMDAVLPLYLLDLFATYVIVILQFAF